MYELKLVNIFNCFNNFFWILVSFLIKTIIDKFWSLFCCTGKHNVVFIEFLSHFYFQQVNGSEVQISDVYGILTLNLEKKNLMDKPYVYFI